MICLEHLLLGRDVIGIFPTGFGKSLIFQLLPDIMSPVSTSVKNIVLVVCPLNSIIRDQMNMLMNLGYPCGMLGFEDKSKTSNHFASENGEEDSSEHVDSSDSSDEEDEVKDRKDIVCPADVKVGTCKLVFGHPEAFLSGNGRKLLEAQSIKKGRNLHNR